MRYASEIDALHNTSTLESLDAIAEADLISAEDAELLRHAWLAATRARNALVLVRGKPATSCLGPDASSTPSRSPPAGKRTGTAARFWTTTCG